MSSPENKSRSSQFELFGQLCNEDVNLEVMQGLNEALASDPQARRRYLLYIDLQAAMRQHAQSVADEDFAVYETQVALDAALEPTPPGKSLVNFGASLESSSSKPAGWGFGKERLLDRRLWLSLIGSAAVILVIVGSRLGLPAGSGPVTAVTRPTSGSVMDRTDTAWLRGSVGARWSGDRLELQEGEAFVVGQRIELIEGLAEVCFLSGAKLVIQGPIILEVQSDREAKVSVGRLAASLPGNAGEFVLNTPTGKLVGTDAEFGADVDVDGSLVTRVYAGAINIGRSAQRAPATLLSEGRSAKVDPSSSEVTILPQPSNIRFVRYLPARDTQVNLADIVAGGDLIGGASHRGISLETGKAVEDYGSPATSTGAYIAAHDVEFVDGVFIPDGGTGPVQVDSIGRTFSGFPDTTGDAWGGSIIARRPRHESSLPRIRLEFHGDNYGYVNWLHVASQPEELSPKRLGLIGIHSNGGITFDLHAIRARHPNKRIVRFSALIGNLESKQDSSDNAHSAEAWVLVDGKLRHHRPAFCRESGPELIELPLSDRDRFLVLAVTDDGKDTAYDWVAFGDATIDLTEGISLTLQNEQSFERARVDWRHWTSALALRLEASASSNPQRSVATTY